MRKLTKLWAGILCGTLLLSMVACGAKSESNSSTDIGWSGNTTQSGGDWNGGWDSSATEDAKDSYYPQEVPEPSYPEYGMETKPMEPGGTDGNDLSLYEDSSRKVIKTANLNLQTTEFDRFTKELERVVESAGAYMQYANVYGNSYYGGNKGASYTIRVPQQNLTTFLDGMEGIATVVSKTVGEQDVTLTYVDMESRIKTLEVEQERLLELLEKATDLDGIIRLEQRLSEVRYEIESYMAQLRTYDDKIMYSTVNIEVSEVIRVTEPEPETIGDRIKSGWSDTMFAISRSAQDFFVWFVVNIPYLLFWTAVIVLAVVLCRRKLNKKRQRKLDREYDKKLDDKE